MQIVRQPFVELIEAQSMKSALYDKRFAEDGDG